MEILLHGDLSGLVIDAETSQPIQAATVKLDPSDNSTITGSNGEYVFRNLAPGSYNIQASANAYAAFTKDINITSAQTQETDFALKGIPVDSVSDTFLDFGFESTSLSFTISNAGHGKLSYYLSPGKDWITVHPASGEITSVTDTITVIINRANLSENTYKESIGIVFIGQDVVQDTLRVYLNGVMGSELYYYKTAKIGTQRWMAENLNAGTRIGSTLPKNNGIIEKWCLGFNESNCNIYGGLYYWDEMMQYHPADNGITGTTQGICPVGWHIPTNTEWLTLINYLGGPDVAGGKLKEEGTVHWYKPNTGATNESGFTALPGDYLVNINNFCSNGTLQGLWWSSSYSTIPYTVTYNSSAVTHESTCIPQIPSILGVSVRCVMDP